MCALTHSYSFDLLEEMKLDGIEPDVKSYCCIMSVCAAAGDVERVYVLHPHNDRNNILCRLQIGRDIEKEDPEQPDESAVEPLVLKFYEGKYSIYRLHQC